MMEKEIKMNKTIHAGFMQPISKKSMMKFLYLIAVTCFAVIWSAGFYGQDNKTGTALIILVVGLLLDAPVAVPWITVLTIEWNKDRIKRKKLAKEKKLALDKQQYQTTELLLEEGVKTTVLESKPDEKQQAVVEKDGQLIVTASEDIQITDVQVSPEAQSEKELPEAKSGG
jgi:hypothetical protein